MFYPLDGPGIELYYSGATSNSIGGWYYSTTLDGHNDDNIDPTLPMAAVNTNDVGGSDLAVFYMVSTGTGGAQQLVYYISPAPGGEPGTWSEQVGYALDAYATYSKYMTTAAWSNSDDGDILSMYFQTDPPLTCS